MARDTNGMSLDYTHSDIRWDAKSALVMGRLSVWNVCKDTAATTDNSWPSDLTDSTMDSSKSPNHKKATFTRQAMEGRGC